MDALEVQVEEAVREFGLRVSLTTNCGDIDFASWLIEAGTFGPIVVLQHTRGQWNVSRKESRWRSLYRGPVLQTALLRAWELKGSRSIYLKIGTLPAEYFEVVGNAKVRYGVGDKIKVRSERCPGERAIQVRIDRVQELAPELYFAEKF